MPVPEGCQRKRTTELPKCSKRLHFCELKWAMAGNLGSEYIANLEPANARSLKVFPVLKPRGPRFVPIQSSFTSVFGSLGASVGSSHFLRLIWMSVAIRRLSPQPVSPLTLEIPSAPVTALARRSTRTLRARALRTTPADGYYLLGLKFTRPLSLATRIPANHRKMLSRV